MLASNPSRMWSALTTVSIGCGGLLLGTALLLSDDLIEGLFLGTTTGALEWGPGLFRILLGFHGLVLILGAILVWRNRRVDQNKTPLHAPSRSDDPGDSRTAASRATSLTTSLTTWWVLGLLCAVALGLRLWRLETGLWLDEILTLVDFVRLPAGSILTMFPDQNQHMLYSLLGHASVSIFGESAWALRLPAALFGTASIAALFLLGRRLAGTTESLLACGLLTVSYHHIWFSQNARGYTGLLLFATVATWAWVSALPQRTARGWIAYVAAVTLGMWTHTTMAFVVLTHALSYIWLFCERHRQNTASHERLGSVWLPLAALLLSTTLTLQLYALSLPDFFRSALHEESMKSQWTNVTWLIKETLSGLKLGFGPSAVVIAGLLLLASGCWSIYRRNRLAAVVMILPGPLLCVTMMMLKHNLWPRFMFFSIGFGLLFAVRGTMLLAQVLVGFVSRTTLTDRRVAIVGTGVWAVVTVASLLTVPRCYALPKQDFAGAREFVNTQIKSADAVVAIGLAALAYERYYAPHWPRVGSRPELEALRHNHADVWLIYTMPTHVETYLPDLWQSIQQNFEEVAVFPGTLRGGEVRVCRQRTASRQSVT